MSIEERLLRPPADIDFPVIVAVACFAGDIAAPAELVSALPVDCGLAVIFVEEPSAGRPSLLSEALMKSTTLPVCAQMMVASWSTAVSTWYPRMWRSQSPVAACTRHPPQGGRSITPRIICSSRLRKSLETRPSV